MIRVAIITAAVLAGVAALSPLAAQPKPQRGEGPPNAMQGFTQNKGQPVHISADRLEVRDKDKVATFSGKVEVNQGDTVLRCKTLTVFYEGGAKDDKPDGGAKDAAKTNEKPQSPVAEIGPGSNQKIKKLEARGGVVVTQKDQVATGDTATFDMQKNVVTMDGNVVLTQGQNVLRGNRLVVDLTTGYSRVESSGGSNGRVQGLFVPSGSQTPTGLPGRPAEKKQGPAR
jgi:lipopolysaccharide export system protein LptA